jgi:High potential iron-sulfur protein
MTDERNSATSRRTFCALLGAGAGAVAFGVLPAAVLAADLPHLTEADPTGSAMGYKEDTKTVDAKKFPMHKPDQDCGKCKYFQGDAAMPFGPCQIFAGKAVSSKGWCQVFAAK